MISLTPIKPIITSVNPEDSRKLCSFIVPQNKIGELHIDMKPSQSGYGYTFITELRNRFRKLLGYEEFAFFEGAKDISGLYIKVDDEYQRRGYNLGEILRLSSIIGILENKVKNFNIVSKDTAIYFHSKYKFQPNVATFYERNNLLETVANNKSAGFEEFTERAKKLLDEISLSGNAEEQRKHTQETNKLLSEYITKVLNNKEQKQHKFNFAMGMTLTDENILKNKEFFNELFKKHGIDYNI